jgi:hypothetical protein
MRSAALNKRSGIFIAVEPQEHERRAPEIWPKER